jgi:sec-independent protein translocase protein TatC
MAAVFKKSAGQDRDDMSFMGHLSVLRWHLVRSAIVITVLAAMAFAYPEILFGEIVLGPSKSHFLTFKVLCHISHLWNMGDALCFSNFGYRFQNIDVTGQFTSHMWVALVAGLIVGFPYLLWELWRFIKPALAEKEIRAARGFIAYASILFLMGVLFSYYIVSPLAVYFLGNYQVDPSIENKFTLDSYISVVSTLVLLLGLVFEMPIVAFFLGRFGVLTADFLRRNRRYALIIILILSAVITPTTDVFTQMLVAVPLWVLFEASILVVRREEKRHATQI